MAPEPFTKLPVVVTVEQFDGLNGEDIAAWVKENNGTAIALPGEEFDDLRIQTREGLKIVDVGAWVIRGPAGDFYPCAPDVFAASYAAGEQAIAPAVHEALPEADVIDRTRPEQIEGLISELTQLLMRAVARHDALAAQQREADGIWIDKVTQ